MHEFLQISQVLDPALCWTPRYPHNPVGPRGGPYRNQCSPQKLVQSAKNQRNLETVTIGPMSRLPVLAGNVARVWRRNPSRPAASPSSRKGAATRPTWLQGYRTRPLEPKSRLQHGVGAPLHLPRPGIQEGARGPGTTANVAIFRYRRHGLHYFLGM